MMRKIVFLLLISALITAPINAQSKKEKKAAAQAEEFEKIKELIETKVFEFQADWATTSRGKRISLITNHNYLKINNDSANIYLPFFGESHSGGGAYTGDIGIAFEGIVEDFVMSINEKKQNINIKFNGKSKSDSYQFTLTVFRSGNSSLNVNSSYRSNIKYDGDTSKPTPKE